ncbi:MAG: aromatic ring-hydroxylating dioxygenase subunit alpha, partial [Verrucomicrobiota bacterium]|nr:aromatic ring-hydroxylating dioxygenase subunit alpha [Verrucomicrobiota bacterium]
MPSNAPSAFRKTTETFTAGAQTLPQRYFVSPEVFAQEQARIFVQHWVCVGHQSQLVRAGDFFVSEVSGESLVIVRDKSDQVRGYFNVCRHRGTRLCEDATGHAAAIQCPYHAWTYGLDGRLIGAPHMETVSGFDKAVYSLHAVNLGLWEGFIFVSLAENPTPLPEIFAPLEGKFSHWNLTNLRSARRITYDVRANWKLIFQNYSECYHCPGVHPALAKVSPYDSAENDLVEGPFLGGFMDIARGASLTMTGKACARPVGEIRGEDQSRVFYYSIFPNLLLSIHPDYVMVHQICPQSPGRTLIECDWFFHSDAAGDSDFNPEDAIGFWDMTNKQDW